MSFNLTSTWLEARQSIALLPFSKHLDTTSTWLAGAGGVAADGYPLPYSCVVRGIQAYDGYSVLAGSGEVSFGAGDRLSMYATYEGGGLFTLVVTKNGSPTTLTVGSVSGNANVQAVVDLLMMEDA